MDNLCQTVGGEGVPTKPVVPEKEVEDGLAAELDMPVTAGVPAGLPVNLPKLTPFAFDA
jgi:hypothetical protein